MSLSPPSPVARLPIMLYHYPFSPYARRIVWYLRLRGISYMQCLQPPTLPRPDLSAQLSISYRRIPLLAIGRDVYLDTRLILRKLEALPWPSPWTDVPPLGAAAGGGTDTGEALAVERLLSMLTTGGGLFFRAAELLPADLPLMRDEQFRRDREDFFHGGEDTPGGGGGGGGGIAGPVPSGEEGREQPAEGGAAGRERELEKEATRAEALREIRDAMALVEHTLLADGREWILADKSPTKTGPALADIEAVWIFHWMTGIPGALFDASQVSRDMFPRVYAWIERFQAAVGAAKAKVEVGTVSGEEAATILKGKNGEAEYYEPEAEVDRTEPVVGVYGLEKGCRVEVWPTDSGAAHRDRGGLIGLGADEVVWETDAGIRVHAPRHGFRVRRVRH